MTTKHEPTMEPIKVEVFPYCPRIRFVEIREKYQLYKLSEISSLKQVWNIVCVYKPSTCVTIAYTEEQHVYQRVPKPGIYSSLGIPQNRLQLTRPVLILPSSFGMESNTHGHLQNPIFILFCQGTDLS